MRVLITASTLPRRADDALPAFVLDQAIALKRAYPMDVELLAPHDAGAARREVLGGIPTHRFRYFWPAAWQQLVYPAILPNIRMHPWLVLQVPFLVAAEVIALVLHARRFRPTVIYSHWFMPQALAGDLVGRLLGIPHVFTTHSSDVEVLRRVPFIGPALVRGITRRARAFTAVSSRTAGKLQRFFSEAEWQKIGGRLRIIPMGIDVASLASPSSEHQAAARRALGLGSETVLLFIGRLTAKKGLADLLEAAAILAARDLPFILVVAGEGELRAEIEKRITELELGARVRLPGFISGDRKRQWLWASDAIVLPSIVTADGDAEGLPVALLEGMAAGKVCIASDATGADDIVTDGVNGFLAPAGDPVGLARSIAGVLSLAPEMRRATGERAAERVQEFDWAQVAKAHFAHLFSQFRS